MTRVFFLFFIVSHLWTTMALAKLSVTKHEYKVQLNPALFTGDVSQITEQADNFLSAVIKRIAHNSDVLEKFSFDGQKDIAYWDVVRNCTLKHNNLILRSRLGESKNRQEVTLKLRSQYISDFNHPELFNTPHKFKHKLELDVLPQNQFSYSYSLKQKVPQTLDLADTQVVDSLFPYLRQQLSITDKSLKRVADLIVTERKLTEAKILVNGFVYHDLTLSLWYIKNLQQPILVEFSFSLKSDEQQPIMAASDIINIIAKMPVWPSDERLTKTNWLYQYQTDFCQ